MDSSAKGYTTLLSNTRVLILSIRMFVFLASEDLSATGTISLLYTAMREFSSGGSPSWHAGSTLPASDYEDMRYPILV
jgi:hypothetical protein